MLEQQQQYTNLVISELLGVITARGGLVIVILQQVLVVVNAGVCWNNTNKW